MNRRDELPKIADVPAPQQVVNALRKNAAATQHRDGRFQYLFGRYHIPNL
jgi:hypothetical protein